MELPAARPLRNPWLEAAAGLGAQAAALRPWSAPARSPAATWRSAATAMGHVERRRALQGAEEQSSRAEEQKRRRAEEEKSRRAEEEKRSPALGFFEARRDGIG